MTVSSQTQRVSYAGDGSTTNFPVSFLFYSNGDVSVILRNADGTETIWTENTQYTLTGAGNPSGGTLTVQTSPTDYTPANGTTLVIRREVDFVQETDLPADGAFPSEAVERQLDRSVMHAQQLNELIGRSLTLPATSGFSGLSLPEPAANQLLGWNAAATDLENKVAADVDVAAVSAFMQTLLDDNTAEEARSTLGVNADIADNAVTTAKIADGAVTTAKVADSAVTEPKIADNAVTSQKIADNSITSSQIAAAAVGATEIARTIITGHAFEDTVDPSNDQVLIDDASASGLRRTSLKHLGRIKRILLAESAGSSQSSSPSFVATGLFINVTPLSLNSRFLIIVNTDVALVRTGTVTSVDGQIRLTEEGSTVLNEARLEYIGASASGMQARNDATLIGIHYPNSLSLQQYSFEHKRNSSDTIITSHVFKGIMIAIEFDL